MIKAGALDAIKLEGGVNKEEGAGLSCAYPLQV